MKDAEAYSAKSQILKHWMITHPEKNTPPQMAFKINSMFRDCLSRQMEEALRINYTGDRILNSKNEYLTNCISRLTIEEDAWERRERYRQEEEAEKLEVAEVEAFLRSKQHIQMNSNNQPGGRYPESNSSPIQSGGRCSERNFSSIQP